MVLNLTYKKIKNKLFKAEIHFYSLSNFQTRTFGNLVLPEATSATGTSGEINVAINAINGFQPPECG